MAWGVELIVLRTCVNEYLGNNSDTYRDRDSAPYKMKHT